MTPSAEVGAAFVEAVEQGAEVRQVGDQYTAWRGAHEAAPARTRAPARPGDARRGRTLGATARAAGAKRPT